MRPTGCFRVLAGCIDFIKNTLCTKYIISVTIVSDRDRSYDIQVKVKDKYHKSIAISLEGI